MRSVVIFGYFDLPQFKQTTEIMPVQYIDLRQFSHYVLIKIADMVIALFYC